MIVKPFSEGNAIERLSALLTTHEGRSKAIETEIRKVRSGLKGERDAAHYIDATLESSDNYAVIHGLRLETPNGPTQLDHVIISRLMMVFVLETKHFSHGLKITEQGEFLRWSQYERRYQAMESPLMQCDRHEAGLKAFLKANPVFPTRLGMRINPDIKSLVLVNPTSTLIRPERFDTSKVVKADQFFEAIQKEFDKTGVLGSLGRMAQVVSPSTLREIALALAAHDKPIEIDYAGKLGLRPLPPAVANDTIDKADGMDSSTAVVTPPDSVRPDATTGSPSGNLRPTATQLSCKSCGSLTGEIRFGKFGYYWKCLACDGNTKLVLPGPGKLRKEGSRFFYGEEGRPEVLFHQNG